MRKFTKKLFAGVLVSLLGLSVFSPIAASAATNETVTTTHYAVFDWVKHADFITGNDWNQPEGKPSELIHNNRSLAIRIQMFGPTVFFSPTTVSQLLGGGGVWNPTAEGERYFRVTEIQSNVNGLEIDKVELGMYAVNKDGSYAKMDVYEHGRYDADIANDFINCTPENLIVSNIPTEKNPITVLTNLGTIDDFIVRFEHPENIAKYVFKYFQIPEYWSFDQVGWTTDLNDPLTNFSPRAKINKDINKTENYTTQVGDFSPEFSKSNENDDVPHWVKSFSSVFNATIEGVFDYNDKQELSKTSINDVGRDGTRTRDSLTPAGMSPTGSSRDTLNRDGFNFLVDDVWECDSTHTYCNATLSRKNDDDTYYVKHLEAKARYWNGKKTEENLIHSGWDSTDSSWIRHVNAGANPAYKHSGHAHNTVWDIDYETYKTKLPPELQVVSEATYFYQEFSDVNGRNQIGSNVIIKPNGKMQIRNVLNEIVDNPVVGNEIASKVTSNSEGIYRLGVNVKDKLGNSEDVLSSGLFYIDQTAPTIEFSQEIVDKIYTDQPLPDIKVTVKDALSGVEGISVVYYKSKDGVSWESNGKVNVIKDYNNGEHSLVVPETEINKSIPLSIDGKSIISEGYMYYKFKVMSRDNAGNEKDIVSPVFKYDAYPHIEYDLAPQKTLPEDVTKKNWTNQDVKVNIVGCDSESGVEEIRLIQGNQNGYYLIDYELHGGSNVPNPKYYTVNTKTFMLVNPVKPNYDFVGWTGSNGTTPQLNVNITQGTTGNLHFEANWKSGSGITSGGASCPTGNCLPGPYRLTEENTVFDWDTNVIASIAKYPNHIISDAGLLVGSDNHVNAEYLQTDNIQLSDNVYLAIKDKNGHISYTPYVVDHIDKIAPYANWESVPDVWNKETLPTISGTMLDSLSGVKSVEIKRYKSENGKEWIACPDDNSKVTWDEMTNGVKFVNQLRDDGEVKVKVDFTPENEYMYYKVVANIVDVAGNTSEEVSPIIKYDEAPIISYELTPKRLKDDGTLNWTNQDVNVNISVVDTESGVKEVCIANGPEWKDCVEKVFVTKQPDALGTEREVPYIPYVQKDRLLEEQGWYILAIDKNNNFSKTPYVVDHIDKVAPVVNFNPVNEESRNPILVTVTVHDPKLPIDGKKSEIDKWRYKIVLHDGTTEGWSGFITNTNTKDILIDQTGHNIIEVEVWDKAGNKTVSKTSDITILDAPPTIIAKTNYYWVGDDVPDTKLLLNAHAISEIDGDISHLIIITRITYADGTVVEHPDSIDTSVPQSFVAEFEVTDSNGLTTTASQIYQILNRGAVAPEVPDSNYKPEVYQRYVDKDKIAIQDNSKWKLDDTFRTALDEALANSTVKSSKVISKN